MSSLTLAVEALQERGLQFWRERVFSYTLSAMLALGLIALVPSVWLSLLSGFYFLAAVDISAYLFVVGLLIFRRRISYNLRATFLLVIGLAVGIVVFYITGDEGGGLFWMFMVPPLASVLLGLQAGLFFFILNFVLIMITAFLVVIESPLMPGLTEFTIEGWAVYAINFLVTNALVTFPLGALLNGLFKTTEHEKKVVEDYRLLFATNPLPMCVFDSETFRFLAVNDAAIEHYGYNRNEFLAMTIKEIRPIRSVPDLERNFVETRETSRQYSGPRTHRKKDGSLIDVEIFSHSLEFDNRPARLVLAIDITERMAAQKKLQQSDQILERVKSLVLVIDAEGAIIYVSPIAEDLLGYRPEELLGDGWWQLTHANVADGDEEKATLRKVARGQIALRPDPYELPILTQTGETKWIEWQDSIGPDQTVIGVGHDVTERKHAQFAAQLNTKKLDESLRFRQIIIASFSVGILAYEIESGKCVLANEAAATIAGATQDQLLAQNYKIIESWKGSGLLDNALKTISGDVEQRFDTHILTTFGKEVYLSCAFNLFELDGVSHLLLSFSDISEKKRAEQEIVHHLAELVAIRDISVTLRSAVTFDEVLAVLLDSTLKALGQDVGSIWLYDKTQDLVSVVISRGYIGPDGEEIEIPAEKPGEGLAGAVFASGATSISKEHRTNPRIPEAIRGRIPPGVGGVTVPIRAGQEVIGVFEINTAAPRELSHHEVSLLITLVEIAGNAIQRSRLHEKTERQLEQFKVLNEIDQIILSSFDLQFNLKMLLGTVVEQLEVDAANILLYDASTRTLTALQGVGFSTAFFAGAQVALGEGNAGRAASERKAIHIEHLDQQTDNPRLARALSGEGFVSYYGVPLIAKGEVRGVLELFHRKPLLFQEGWLGMVNALAGRAAIAIDTLKVFENLERTNKELVLSYDAAIEGWSQALDLRDKETEGHSQRVTALAVQLARNLGVHGKPIVHFFRGALLHDIGKMGIPDSILLKAGKLTEEEWVIMRRHPTYARDMLENITFLQEAIDIPYGHHEKWDGTGYPRGLVGEQIPLAARIFAVVDVYDALTSDRPYRKAWSKKKTLSYIRKQSGTHFDPRIVDAFLKLELPE